MTTKDTRDLERLRKDIDVAVKRMVEMRDDFAAKSEAESHSREVKEWFDGQATGVDHALYALWVNTGGAHGVDTRRAAEPTVEPETSPAVTS